jgi:hypothetical protein
MTRTHVTSHAALRWTQRVTGSHSEQLTPASKKAAVRGVIRAYRASTKIPQRFVRRLSGGAKKRSGVTYHMTTESLLIMKGHTVVTVYPWTLEDFAEVMVHAFMGLWPDS